MLDRPSTRTCNTSFALIFRTITDCSFRRAPYKRGGRCLAAGGPHGHYHRPPSAIFAVPAAGTRREYLRTPVRQIFSSALPRDRPQEGDAIDSLTLSSAKSPVSRLSRINSRAQPRVAQQRLVADCQTRPGPAVGSVSKRIPLCRPQCSYLQSVPVKSTGETQ